MRTRLRSLCISSQASSRVHFCLLPMSSRMPAPSHARCPHATCHAVATQTPCLGLTQGRTPNTIRTSQRSMSWARAASSPAPSPGQLAAGTQGCVSTSQPRAYPGTCIQGRLHFKKKIQKVKKKKKSTLHFKGSLSLQADPALPEMGPSCSPGTPGSSQLWPVPELRARGLQSGRWSHKQKSEKRPSTFFIGRRGLTA